MIIIYTILQSVSSLPIETESISLWELLLQGGFLMIPLFILLIWSIYLFIDKYLYLKRAYYAESNGFIEKLVPFFSTNNKKEFMTICKTEPSSLSHILKRAIDHHDNLNTSLSNIKISIELEGKRETSYLKKGLSNLATIAGISPLIGFTGTVTGMIEAFISIQALEGNINPSVLAGGIWEALITTAIGLIIGIIAYVFYNTLLSMYNKVLLSLELGTEKLLLLLNE